MFVLTQHVGDQATLPAPTLLPSLLQRYDPVLDKKMFAEEVQRLSSLPAAMEVMERMHVIPHDKFVEVTHIAHQGEKA